MTDRPLPLRWSGDTLDRKLDEVAARMALYLLEHPESRLRVAPRHLLGRRCTVCQHRVIATTGELDKYGRCGPCALAQDSTDPAA